jgi:biopolymer transport protein ExbB
MASPTTLTAILDHVATPLTGLFTLAQAGTPGAPAGAPVSDPGVSIVRLFWQSSDLFTILLVIGSIAAGTVIVRCIIELRASRITPLDTERQLRRILADGNLPGLDSYLQNDTSFYGHVLRAAMTVPAHDRPGVRNAAELAASEQCARWFRKIEPLNVIGNLGPLLGLAGTVYGMVLAFVKLGSAGGQANPGLLSGEIGKALFHTLLGLVVAIPALLVFGLYRSQVDKLCTRALGISAELVELLCDAREAQATRPVPHQPPNVPSPSSSVFNGVARTGAQV